MISSISAWKKVTFAVAYSELPLAGTTWAGQESVHPESVPLRGTGINEKVHYGTIPNRSSRERSRLESVPAEGVNYINNHLIKRAIKAKLIDKKCFCKVKLHNLEHYLKWVFFVFFLSQKLIFSPNQLKITFNFVILY